MLDRCSLIWRVGWCRACRATQVMRRRRRGSHRMSWQGFWTDWCCNIWRRRGVRLRGSRWIIVPSSQSDDPDPHPHHHYSHSFKLYLHLTASFLHTTLRVRVGEIRPSQVKACFVLICLCCISHPRQNHCSGGRLRDTGTVLPINSDSLAMDHVCEVIGKT